MEFFEDENDANNVSYKFYECVDIIARAYREVLHDNTPDNVINVAADCIRRLNSEMINLTKREAVGGVLTDERGNILLSHKNSVLGIYGLLGRKSEVESIEDF